MRGSMHLRRIDPNRNMARFYTMSVQPTLFGEWALLREWGRIGSAGRLVQRRFASEQEAALAMTAHLKARLTHGYVQCGGPSNNIDAVAGGRGQQQIRAIRRNYIDA